MEDKKSPSRSGPGKSSHEELKEWGAKLFSKVEKRGPLILFSKKVDPLLPERDYSSDSVTDESHSAVADESYSSVSDEADFAAVVAETDEEKEKKWLEWYEEIRKKNDESDSPDELDFAVADEPEVFRSVVGILYSRFRNMAKELVEENPGLDVLARQILELIKKPGINKGILEKTASDLLGNEKVLNALVKHAKDDPLFEDDVGSCLRNAIVQKEREPVTENTQRLRADCMYDLVVNDQDTDVNVLCQALSIVFGFWVGQDFFDDDSLLAAFKNVVETKKTNGEMTTDAAREIAKRIVSFVLEELQAAEASSTSPEFLERLTQKITQEVNMVKPAQTPEKEHTEDFERPKKRARPVAWSSQPNEDNLILELLNTAPSLYCEPLRVAWDTSAFGVENDTPLCIHHSEVLEVILGRVEPSMPIIQLWVVYLNSLSLGMGSEYHFGFFEPQSIQNLGMSEEATAYIRKHVQNSKKHTYLGAYQQEGNWQLFVLKPKEGIVVWLCPQNREPDPITKDTIEGLMTQFYMLEEHLELTKVVTVRWVYPQVFRQEKGWESGYYVMHWMRCMVQEEMHFQNTPLEDLALPRGDKDEIRSQWARYFFEVKNRLSVDK